MRQTIAEKILSDHSGKRVRSGDVVIANVDFCFSQDGTSGLVIDSFKRLGVDGVFNKDKFCMVMDHTSPSPTIGEAEDHKRMRQFTREHGLKLFDIECGISHQIIPEAGYVTCGDLILGADSHSCTYGAVNAMATGVGATDLAIAMAGGKNWFMVPETIKVVIDGELPKGTYAKDVILHVIKDIGREGAAYKAIEFYGDVIDSLTMDGRFTIANMSVEMGAKCGLMAADKKTLNWAKKYALKDPNPVDADEDARYAEVREYDVSELGPQVAKPHSVDNVTDIEDLIGVEIHEVFIGTCANGRLEDIEIAASILKGKTVAPGLKLIITPASKRVFLDAIKKGYIDIFIQAGASVNNPGCGPCVGAHQGVLADGENVFSTANRNFEGRMGNPKGNIYLGSPAAAAATAISGKISDPRDHKRRL